MQGRISALRVMPLAWLVTVTADDMAVVGVNAHTVELAIFPGVEREDVTTAIVGAHGSITVAADDLAGSSATDAPGMAFATIAT